MTNKIVKKKKTPKTRIISFRLDEKLFEGIRKLSNRSGRKKSELIIDSLNKTYFGSGGKP